MAFTKKTWVDVPDPLNPPEGAEALDAENLNRIEDGIAEVYTEEIPKLFPKSGGIISGEIYKNSEDEENTFITKKDLNDFIYYLNNESPLTLKRDNEGDTSKISVSISSAMDSIYPYRFDGTDTSSTKINVVAEDYCILNWIKPHEYKSTIEQIDLEYRFPGSQGDYGSFSNGEGANIIQIKNSMGDVVLEKQLTRDSNNSQIIEGSLDFSNIETGTYSISLFCNNVNLYVTSSSGISKRYIYLSKCNYSYYERDIIEFN